MPDPIVRAIQRAPYEHPPVYIRGGASYVEARELARSATFWRVVARMRGLPGAGKGGT